MEMTASVLDGQRFLHGLRAEQLDALAATASEVKFPAGHRVFADGGYVDLDVQGTSSPGGCSRYSRDGCKTPGPSTSRANAGTIPSKDAPAGGGVLSGRASW
jgi:hypothetical protein